MKKLRDVLLLLAIAGCLYAAPWPHHILSDEGSYLINAAEGGREVKHEIVTVTDISPTKLTVTNDKKELYAISNWDDRFPVEIGTHIGISYTDKVRMDNGQYSLSIVSITKEGPILPMPPET